MTLRYNQDREGSFKCFAIKKKIEFIHVRIQRNFQTINRLLAE